MWTRPGRPSTVRSQDAPFICTVPRRELRLNFFKGLTKTVKRGVSKDRQWREKTGVIKRPGRV